MSIHARGAVQPVQPTRTRSLSLLEQYQTLLFSEFRELWSVGPVTPGSDMHQSFTGTIVKWFLDNVPMFADSFSVLSIHCVARGLGARFLCKYHALRGGSVRQHGFLVEMYQRTDRHTYTLVAILRTPTGAK